MWTNAHTHAPNLIAIQLIRRRQFHSIFKIQNNIVYSVPYEARWECIRFVTRRTKTKLIHALFSGWTTLIVNLYLVSHSFVFSISINRSKTEGEKQKKSILVAGVLFGAVLVAIQCRPWRCDERTAILSVFFSFVYIWKFLRALAKASRSDFMFGAIFRF